jgi:hypothetical protein
MINLHLLPTVACFFIDPILKNTHSLFTGRIDTYFNYGVDKTVEAGSKYEVFTHKSTIAPVMYVEGRLLFSSTPQLTAPPLCSSADSGTTQNIPLFNFGWRQL